MTPVGYWVIKIGHSVLQYRELRAKLDMVRTRVVNL